MLSFLIHLCQSVFGFKQLNDRRNTGFGAMVLPCPRGYTSTEENAPISQQPKLGERQHIYLRQRTDSIESDITGLGRRLILLMAAEDIIRQQRFEVKKPLVPSANVTRSATSSQENLMSFSRNIQPTEWNPHRKPARQWAPVKFYPCQKNHTQEHQQQQTFSEIRAQSQSAPVTPIGRSTPVERPGSKELLSPNPPKVELFVDRHKNRSSDNKTMIVTSQPVFFSVTGLQKSGNLTLLKFCSTLELCPLTHLHFIYTMCDSICFSFCILCFVQRHFVCQCHVLMLVCHQFTKACYYRHHVS